MNEHAVPRMELLLAHSAWIRSLARRLVGEGAGADDLVQETWLAALERPPAAVRSERGWLAGVLANLARENRRGEARLRMREQRVARGAEERSEPSAADLCEAASTGRDLASLVLELEEPFRTAVLLRYYEDLPPRRIASRLGIPVRTVHSQLARGLARLRERWKQRERAAGRDDETWARALLVLAGPLPGPGVPIAASVSGAALPIGVALMNAKIWTGAALLGAGALAWWLSPARPGEPRADDASSVPRAEPEIALRAPGGPEEIVPTPRAPERRSIASPAGSEPAEPVTPGPTRTIRGRVLDPDARPLSGVEIYDAWSDVEPRRTATSGAGGVFELEYSPGGGDLRATDPALVTVMSGRVFEHSEVEPLVVVAPRIELAGVVLDENGAPLSEARIAFEQPRGFSTRFYAVFDATENHGWNAETDERGRFELTPVPSIAGSSLVVELEGFETWRGEVPWAGDRDLVVTLVRSHAAVPVVVGRVVDPEERPVPGAWVSLGKRSTATDAAGEFRLERDDAQDAFELRAMKRGHRLARLRAEEDAAGRPAWPDYVVLVLGGPPLSLAGRVVDGAGKPRAGMRLWIGDATPFGVLADEMLASVEYFLGGGEEGDGYWAWKLTDDEGRFRLGGLLERDYTVRVFDPRTLEIQESGPHRAGEESLEIVFDDGPLAKISGRVVTRDGLALAGAQVSVLGNTFGGVWLAAANAISDADGRFSFSGIGGEVAMLTVSGEDVMPLWQSIQIARGGEREIELTVAVRCTFKVDLGPAAERADSLSVLDGDGARMKLFQIGPGGSVSSDSFPLVEGRSDSLGVEDSARTLVLLKGGVEVQRVAIELRRGVLNLLTP